MSERCQTRTSRFGRLETCKCEPRCKVCGHGPHAAAHLPPLGESTGHYDHEYRATTEPEESACPDCRVKARAKQKPVQWPRFVPGDQS